MEDNLGVSLVKYLCPICCDVADEGIIMNSLLTKQNAEEVKKMHNKAIGLLTMLVRNVLNIKIKLCSL